MEPTTIVKRNEGVLSTDIDGEAVLMTVDSGNYFTLNAVGSTIWSLIENPLTLTELQDQLLEQFDGDRATILSESKAYIQDLATRGLLGTAK